MAEDLFTANTGLNHSAFFTHCLLQITAKARRQLSTDNWPNSCCFFWRYDVTSSCGVYCLVKVIPSMASRMYVVCRMKKKEYFSYDIILHEKDANIVFNDDWYYSDGMQRLGRNGTSSINGNSDGVVPEIRTNVGNNNKNNITTSQIIDS